MRFRTSSWVAGTLLGAAVAVAALLAGAAAWMVLAALLGGGAGWALVGTGRLVAHVVRVGRDRAEVEEAAISARRGSALAGAHDALVPAQWALDELEEAGDGRWTGPARDALERLRAIAGALDASRPHRRSMVDEAGRLPAVGGHAVHTKSWRDDRLPYGRMTGLSSGIPYRLRLAIRQIGHVLDEIRLLHNSQIEHAVFLFTLTGRAAVVVLAPLLATSAPTPLTQTKTLGDVVWGLAVGVSLVTTALAPAIVDRAMEDSPQARRLRTRLLWLEVPLSVAVLVALPTWAMAVFAVGSTNWWQRQTARLAFSWSKLAWFVLAVVVLQAAGLAIAGVGLGPAALEIGVALLAILVIGSSYGAMLPVALGTAFAVVWGDTRRSLRAIRQSRDELLSCATALTETVAAIEHAGADSPAARRAAQTARQAARQLEAAADRVGRRGLLASQVLAELTEEAIARSYLARRSSPTHRAAAQAASERGEPEPAYATAAVFSPTEIRFARIARQADAKRLRELLERALNESLVHGVGGTRILVDEVGERIVIRIGNLARGGTRGTAGEGSGALVQLAEALPGGRHHHAEMRPESDVGLPGSRSWWVVEVSCSSALLEPGR